MCCFYWTPGPFSQVHVSLWGVWPDGPGFTSVHSYWSKTELFVQGVWDYFRGPISLGEGGVRVIILSHHSPSSLKQPLIRDSHSKALLSAMSEKTGNKVFVSNSKSWLDHFSAAGQGGVGVDWALVQIHIAPLSKQAIKNAIKQWGNNKWQLRWAKLAACQQTKVWFPAIKNVPAHFVRRLNRFHLSHVIHFTTGHNNLLRHRCKLAGGGGKWCVQIVWGE